MPPTKTYAIIGGTSGMGLATAQYLLSKHAAQVAILDISAENRNTFHASLPPSQHAHCMIQTGSVADPSAVESFLENAKTHFRVRVLNGVANFAGTPGHELGTEAVWQTSQEEYEFLMDVNVRGLFNVLNVALRPGFLVPEGEGDEETASVVHIGSMFSLQGFKNGAVFAATKHAALGMVRSAAKETGGKVRVNCVLPGVMDTPMHRANLARVRDFAPTADSTTPIPRDGKAEEVASVVAFLLSEGSTFVTGAAWSVDGGDNA